MKFGLFGKAMLLAGVLSFGGVRAEDLASVLTELRSFQWEILQRCEWVQVSQRDTERRCTPEQQQFIDYMREKIEETEKSNKDRQFAAYKARLENLVARANSLKK